MHCKFCLEDLTLNNNTYCCLNLKCEQLYWLYILKGNYLEKIHCCLDNIKVIGIIKEDGSNIDIKFCGKLVKLQINGRMVWDNLDQFKEKIKAYSVLF